MYKTIAIKTTRNYVRINPSDRLLVNFAKFYLVLIEDRRCSDFSNIFIKFDADNYFVSPEAAKKDLDLLPNDLKALVMDAVKTKAPLMVQQNYKPFCIKLIDVISNTFVIDEKNIGFKDITDILRSYDSDREVLSYKLKTEYSYSVVDRFLSQFDRKDLLEKCFKTSSIGYLVLKSDFRDFLDGVPAQFVAQFDVMENQSNATYFTSNKGESDKNIFAGFLLAMAQNNSDIRVSVDYWMHNHPLSINGLSDEATKEGHQFSVPNKVMSSIDVEGGFIVMSQIGETDLNFIENIKSLAILVSSKGIAFVDQKKGLIDDKNVLRQLKQSLMRRDIEKYLSDNKGLSDYQIRILSYNLSKYLLEEKSLDDVVNVVNRFEFNSKAALLRSLYESVEKVKKELGLPIEWQYREVTAYEKGQRAYFVSNNKLERLEKQTQGKLSKYDIDTAIQFIYLTGSVQREELLNKFKQTVGQNDEKFNKYELFFNDLVKLSKAESIEDAEEQVALIKLKLDSL